MLRWGLISTARINRRIIPAIRSSQLGTLHAVASRDKVRADSYAAKWEIPASFGSYEEMLDSGEVDIVYISLPNHLHAAWSIRAMQAGVHVLCEKPLALTVEEVDAISTTSHETHKICAEAFMYRHHPQTKIAGDWAHSGRLGEISCVRGVFNFTISDLANIRLTPAYGGGCLWDVGVYPLSFSQYIMGTPPETVMGTQWIGESGVDETFAGQLMYTGNRIAQVTSSFRSPYFTSFDILGTEGCLTLNRPFTGLDADRHLYHLAKDGTATEIPVPKIGLYQGEIEDIQLAILEHKPNYISLSESRNLVKTVTALYESARHRRSIEIV